MVKEKEVKVACLAKPSVAKRLDRVAAKFAPEAGALSRAQAMRAALEEGLAVLERKLKLPPIEAN